jgi:hypothetical protein
VTNDASIYLIGSGGVPVFIPGWKSAPCRVCGRAVLEEEPHNVYVSMVKPGGGVVHDDCEAPEVIAREKPVDGRTGPL